MRSRLLPALVVVLVGCASRAPTADSPPRSHERLTDRQYGYAVAVARREADRTARTITSATVTLRRGTVTNANRGHQCVSGTELYIKLIGTFNIAVGGAAVHSISSASADAYEVHAVLITVDAATGDECLFSVQTGTVRPDRGATVLFTR